MNKDFTLAPRLRKVAFLVATAIFMVATSITVFADNTDGSGTKEDPYVYMADENGEFQLTVTGKSNSGQIPADISIYSGQSYDSEYEYISLDINEVPDESMPPATMTYYGISFMNDAKLNADGSITNKLTFGGITDKDAYLYFSSAGQTMYFVVTPYHVHMYDEVVNYIKKPSCTESGSAIFKCSCGDEQTLDIDPLGHKWEMTWFAENGVQFAYQQEECVRCLTVRGEKIYDTVEVRYVTAIENGDALSEDTKTVNKGTFVRGYDLGQDAVVIDGISYKVVGDSSAYADDGVTVYRYVVKKEYTVHYDPNGGVGTISSYTVQYGDTYTAPTEGFTKENYELVGWAETPDGAVKYTPGGQYINIVPISSDVAEITLYAVWQGVECSVIYDVDGVQEEVSIRYGDKLGDAPVFDLPEGSAVVGWYYTVDDAPIYVTSETVWKFTEETVLYGEIGQKSISITWVAANETKVESVQYGVTNPNPPVDTSAAGMTFKHWSLTMNGSAYDFSKAITDSITLYAVYSSNTIKLNLNGEKIVTRVYGDVIGDLPSINYPGQEFVGYYYDPEFKQAVNPTDAVPAADTFLYAKLDRTVYTITFAGFDQYKISISYGDSITNLHTPTQDGSTFLGWYYDGNQVQNGDLYNWEKDIQLTATWQVETFSVTKPDGTVEQIAKGANIGHLPNAPDKAGQKFVGYKDQFGNWVTEATAVTQNLVISWEYEYLKVNLILHDDSWSSTVTRDAGVEIEDLPTRSKSGYTFKGWSTVEGGSVTTGPFYTDTDLYAIFEGQTQQIYLQDLNQYVQRKTGDQLGGLPAGPGKEGYEFVGWTWKGADVTAETVVPVGGMTLVAKYNAVIIDEEDTVEIRYWSDGVKIDTVDLPRGEILWNPGAPALQEVDSRGFSHWSQRENGSAYTFGNRVNSDLDLYAVWN